jgi:glycerophosphoryl diester phosphodiesterase
MFEIHGHRGAKALLPENSLRSYEYALNLGIEAIEVDIALTRDKVPVLHHDRAIKVSANKHAGRLIRDLSLAEVLEVEIGPQDKIPTLDSFLKLGTQHTLWNSKTQSGKVFRFNLEIKTHPLLLEETHEPEEFVKAILESLRENSIPPDRVLFQSFDPRMILALNEAQVQSPKSFLIDVWSEDIVEVAQELRCQALSPEWTQLSAERALQILDAGLGLYTWTANTPEAWKKLKDWGVEGIITDDPAALLKWRQQHN